MKPTDAALLVLLATAVVPASARADELDPRVMVLPVEGEAPATLGGLSEEVASALSRGAARTTSSVARATASLEDTAVIVGCDPETPDCRDAVAAALNVDQLLLARIAIAGSDATVEVTAVTREGEPVVRSFPVRMASRAADLAALEREVPIMLEAGEQRREPEGDGDGDGEAKGKTGTGAGTGTGMGAGAGGGVERRDVARPTPVGPLIVTSAGAVLAALGGVSWALASAKQGEIDDAPIDTAADLDRLADLEDAARLRATVGNVLVIGGALTVAAGVTWWLLDRGGDDETALSVGPAVFTRGGGLAVGGRW